MPYRGRLLFGTPSPAPFGTCIMFEYTLVVYYRISESKNRSICNFTPTMTLLSIINWHNSRAVGWVGVYIDMYI